MRVVNLFTVATIFLSLFFIVFAHASAFGMNIDMLNKRDDGAKMVYSEDVVHIEVGEAVTWLPTDKGHNVEFIAAPEGFDIPKKSKLGKEYTMTFEIPGIYLYQCTPHKGMGMIALVVVGHDTTNKDAVAKAKVVGKSKKKLKALLGDL